MKTIIYKRLSGLITMLFACSLLCPAQVSLFFESSATGYPINYTFSTGDIVHFTAGKNTGTSNTCEGSEAGVVRPNRIQDTTPTLELKSTSASSIIIYGKSSSSSHREVHKVETATALDGTYTDITSSLTITNAMRYANCGKITIEGLSLSKGSFVKIYITTDDGVTAASTNISEFYITPDTSTGIDIEKKSPKNIVDKRYYNLTGIEVEENATGIVIEKVTYEDGSVGVTKVIEK